MRGWLKTYWWLVIMIPAIALLIGWKEKRGQSQADQCRSQYASELSIAPIGQKAAEQQAIAAACEPNSYFYRLFSAANLPTMLLVLVGIGGIWTAIRTLNAIEGQTQATQKSVELQEALNRQWIDIEEVEHEWVTRFDPTLPQSINLKFSLVNNTKMPLKIRSIFTQVLQTKSHTANIGHVLAPTKDYPVVFPINLTEAQIGQYRTGGYIVVVSGQIEYTDSFDKIRKDPFGFMANCDITQTTVHPHPYLDAISPKK